MIKKLAKTAALAATLITITSVGPATAQLAPVPPTDGAGVAKVCANEACRRGGYDVVVRLDSTHATTIPVAQTPYILDDGAILIFPGETFAIQFTVTDGKLTAPLFYKAFTPHLPALVKTTESAVANPTDATLPPSPPPVDGKAISALPPNTILLSYGPSDQVPGANLVIESNLPATLKFNAVMYAVGATGFRQSATTTCPIQSGLMAFENWQQPLGPMILTRARLLGEHDSMVCD